MNITEEHRQKAREVRIMLYRLEPEVKYCLSDFMDFQGQSDEGMRSPTTPATVRALIDEIERLRKALEKIAKPSLGGKQQQYMAQQALGGKDGA